MFSLEKSEKASNSRASTSNHVGFASWSEKVSHSKPTTASQVGFASWCQKSRTEHEEQRKVIEDMNRTLAGISDQLMKQFERYQMLKVDLISEMANPDLAKSLLEAEKNCVLCQEAVENMAATTTVGTTMAAENE